MASERHRASDGSRAGSEEARRWRRQEGGGRSQEEVIVQALVDGISRHTPETEEGVTTPSSKSAARKLPRRERSTSCKEIDERYRLFTPGKRVLDLGCRPGSWLQYAGQKVGSQGALVGIDRQPLQVAVRARAFSSGMSSRYLPTELRAASCRPSMVLSDLGSPIQWVRRRPSQKRRPV